MRRWRSAVSIAAVVLLAVPLSVTNVHAQTTVDDVVWDQANCDPNPVNPVLSNYKVSGSGSIANCRSYMWFEVCLDYNGMIFQPSCRKYNYPATSGTTNVVDCKPGVWATTVIITPPPAGNTVLAYIERHSNPLIVYKDCVRISGST